MQAACYEGHETIIRLLIDNHADVNAQGGYFGTALQAASAEGHIDIVLLLFENHANVNARGGYFGTAQMAAYAEGHEKVATFLNQFRADFRTNPNTNIRTRTESPSTKRGFLSGANPDTKTRWNALLASVEPDPLANDSLEPISLANDLPENQETKVEVSLQVTSNADAQRIYHMALTEAAEGGHEKIVRLLIEKMENTNMEGKHDNAKWAASIKGHEKIVRLLLEKGADVNARTYFYDSTLQKVSRPNHENFIEQNVDFDTDE